MILQVNRQQQLSGNNLRTIKIKNEIMFVYSVDSLGTLSYNKIEIKILLKYVV